MKISTQTRYAIRFLIELSLSGDHPSRMTTHSIAKRQGLSEKYLESIAAKLRRGDFIRSVKGAGGGYILDKSPQEITLGMIMRHMETTFFHIPCSDLRCEDCAIFEHCTLIPLFQGVENQLAGMVDGITLAQMREDYRESLKRVMEDREADHKEGSPSQRSSSL